MSRGRPVGGRPTRRACGRRWPPMTRCCAMRSRSTGAGCSSTPVTGCAPRSRHPIRGGCRGGRAAGTGVAGADGHRDRRSRVAGGGLLRCGAQSCGAGDGRRAWRSDPVGRVDGGSAQRRRSGGSGAAAVAGSAHRGRGVPGPSRGPAHGLSGVAGAGCESGEPAACDHQLHRARVRGRRGASGGEGASVGDVDRGGRGRQDPPGDRGRGRLGR